MATLPDITEHFHIEQAFCYPDWAAIGQSIEDNLPESEWYSAWDIVTLRWIEKIRDKLAGGYQIYTTPNFMILSEAPARIIKDACHAYEEALKKILTTLEGVASDGGYGKHVVMMFTTIDDYYAYITHFYPEGDLPMSGGICIHKGYIHFALLTTDYNSYRTTLVHELTHGCVTHLPIPSWLNEALAMRMEQVICDSTVFHLDQEMYDRHLAYWDEETIQQFWSGESWTIPGEGFELSYNLALVLWQKIETRLSAPRAAVFEFILNAHFDDAGEAACQDTFGLSLGDLVSSFLGEGPWTPAPALFSLTNDQPPQV
jgi:hypothetical protein